MSSLRLSGQSLGPVADELVLEVDGLAISGWTDVQVTRSIERVVSSFECTLTERYPGAADVVIKPGTPCRVLLGDDLVVTGYVDRYVPEFDAHSHTVRISGRGKLQDMVDCSASWPGSQFSNQKLSDIAKELLKLHDIAVIVQSDTGPVLPQIIVNVGDSVFDVLEPIARYRALLMYEDTGGDLIFSKVGTARAASGFKEGDNVESAGIAYSMDQRYSLYSAYRTKFAAFKDTGQEANLIADIQDPGVPRYRPKFFVAETNDGGFDVAKRRAVWEALRRAARSAAVHMVVDSWRDNAGNLWQPNTLAPIELPTLKLKKAEWLISEVTYHRNAGGTHALLTLMHPDAFAPEPTNLQAISNALAQALQNAADSAQKGGTQ